jgi:hypothetical protein
MAFHPAAGASSPCSIAPWLSVRNGARAVDFYKNQHSAQLKSSALTREEA